jgi:hypothetical protein
MAREIQAPRIQQVVLFLGQSVVFRRHTLVRSFAFACHRSFLASLSHSWNQSLSGQPFTRSLSPL